MRDNGTMVRLVLGATAALLLLPPAAAAQVLPVPVLPARERELDLFTREVGGGTPGGGAVRILRYGRRGTPARPDVLDIPQVGRAFILQAYDLLAPTTRTVEIRRLPGYGSWLQAEPGSFAIPLDEDRFELVYGTVRWQTGQEDTSDLGITAGPFLFRGRGEALLRRLPGQDGRDVLHVEILRGRFQVSRGETLLAVLAPGREQRFHLNGEERLDSADALAAARRTLAERLAAATLRFYEEGSLPGDVTAELWEAVLELAPRYAHAEVHALPEVANPDLLLRYMGEALRLLAVFSFTPPPYAGM